VSDTAQQMGAEVEDPGAVLFCRMAGIIDGVAAYLAFLRMCWRGGMRGVVTRVTRLAAEEPQALKARTR